MTEVSTNVKVTPNCKFVEVTFKEPGQDTFELEMKLIPADALFLAHELQAAAHRVLEETK